MLCTPQKLSWNPQALFWSHRLCLGAHTRAAECHNPCSQAYKRCSGTCKRCPGAHRRWSATHSHCLDSWNPQALLLMPHALFRTRVHTSSTSICSYIVLGPSRSRRKYKPSRARIRTTGSRLQAFQKVQNIILLCQKISFCVGDFCWEL